jgi:hypothetical protein
LHCSEIQCETAGQRVHPNPSVFKAEFIRLSRLQADINQIHGFTRKFEMELWRNV